MAPGDSKRVLKITFIPQDLEGVELLNFEQPKWIAEVPEDKIPTHPQDYSACDNLIAYGAPPAWVGTWPSCFDVKFEVLPSPKRTSFRVRGIYEMTFFVEVDEEIEAYTAHDAVLAVEDGMSAARAYDQTCKWADCCPEVGRFEPPRSTAPKTPEAEIVKAAENDPEIVAHLNRLGGKFDLGVFPLIAFFEHGQWFIECRTTGAQWAVHDLVTPTGEQSFCFEQISEGENL